MRTASNGRQAIKEVARCSPSIALLDFRLPDINGMKVLEEIRKVGQDLLAIMVTAHGDVKCAVRAMKMVAFDYVAKPFDDDVRILAASNVLLSEQVRQGRFREDLFHRLNEYQIEAPRLAERAEDIPISAKYFLEEANSEFCKNVKGFSPEAM